VVIIYANNNTIGEPERLSCLAIHGGKNEALLHFITISISVSINAFSIKEAFINYFFKSNTSSWYTVLWKKKLLSVSQPRKRKTTHTRVSIDGRPEHHPFRSEEDSLPLMLLPIAAKPSQPNPVNLASRDSACMKLVDNRQKKLQRPPNQMSNTCLLCQKHMFNYLAVVSCAWTPLLDWSP